MSKNNYPNVAIDEAIPPEKVRALVHSLKQLHDMGRPQTDAEVSERIDYFFQFCEYSNIRPGIESLCLALHISRQTLLNWSNGVKCTPERQQIVQAAKAYIGAYLEQALLSGKINPASGIFLAKNWLGYKDSISIDEAAPRVQEQKRTLEEIQALYSDDYDSNKPPVADF